VLKTLATPLRSSGVVGTFVRAAGRMGLGDSVLPLKEPGFVLNAYVCARRQQGVVAEWSACPPVNLATRVRFSDPFHFSFFLSPRPRHLSTPPKTADERLLGGRVVSVATLPVMVSRLG